MYTKFMVPLIVLMIGALSLIASPVKADEACDAEVVMLQAEIDAPTTYVNEADLENSQQLLDVLREDCNSGITLSSVVTLAEQIRLLLGMGEA